MPRQQAAESIQTGVNKMKNLILTLLVMGISGCALFNEDKKTGKQEPPETIVNIPLQVPGVMLSGNDRGKLRTEENIKSYYIGRHVDAVNPDLLHPAGIVLEVVGKPRWIMTPRGVDVPSGVPTRLVENKCSQSLITEFRHDMETIRYSAETLKQSKKELEECRQAMKKVTDQFNQAMESVNKQTGENEEIRQQIADILQKIADLENKNLFIQEKNEGSKK